MTTLATTEKIPAIVPKRFTVDEFRKMTEAGILPEESGWEIIDGYLVDKMSIGSKRASVVKKLNRRLTLMFGNALVVSVQDPIHIDKYNQPEPDIALLKPREDFYEEEHPRPADVLLLIEVSNSTVETDRAVKKTLYAEAGIEEFWLVNLKENTIECYSSPKNGNFRLAQIFETGESVASKKVENLVLQVEEITGS